jgi:hypothetical protein
MLVQYEINLLLPHEPECLKSKLPAEAFAAKIQICFNSG